jgi:hypothetical protein
MMKTSPSKLQFLVLAALLTVSAATVWAASAIQYQAASSTVFNASVSSGPAYLVFAWSGFTDGSGTTLEASKVGDSVTIPLSVPLAGVYDVQVATKKHVNRGIVQLSINGSNVGSPMNQYSENDVWQAFDLGTVSLAAGNQPFKFTTTGTSAHGFTQAFDYIKLTEVSQTAVSVSILPTSAIMQKGQTQQFTAAVSGSSDTAVNWLVSGIQGGNSTVGTISSSGLYTAPSTAPTNPVTVTAESASDVSASANATVTISSIPENEETAFIYVDPNKGNDSNPGTQAKPLQTIQAAAALASENNKKKIGTRVTLNPGTYRENAQYNAGSGNTSAPITFEAADNGTAILSGSDLYTDWKASGNVFTHSWTSLGGACGLPNGWPSMWPIVLRREMVFVNGTPLTQVISSDEMIEGTFYVDDGGGQISVWPPTGTNMSTATVEVAVRPGVFTLAGATNFVFRGLTFEHAATCPQGGNALTINNSTGVLVDTDNFLWNNDAGLGFYEANNVVVQNSVANHNGAEGFSAAQGKNYNYNNNETSYNNWRGAMAAFYGWSYAGTKILLMHTADFNGFKTYYNQTGGIWFDTDNENITLENLASSNNLQYGMFLEASEGPITITDSQFCNNHDNEDPVNSTGTLSGGNAEYVTVSGSLFYNNAIPHSGGEIKIGGTSAGRSFTNWETGEPMTVQSQNWTLSNNTVVGVGSTEELFYSYLNGSVWNPLFTSTFASNNNTWWNASNANVFTTSAGTFNFAKWQSVMGRDADSTFSNPGVSCAPPTPDYPDYWLTTYFDGETQTVAPGASASYTVQVFPVGAFTGTVSLSVNGATQIGATASLGAQSITASGSTTLTVNTSKSTTVGTFPITVVATSGSVVRTLTLTLTVQ